MGECWRGHPVLGLDEFDNKNLHNIHKTAWFPVSAQVSVQRFTGNAAMALYMCLFSSSELSEDGTIRTARLNSFSQIITASKSDFCVKQSIVSCITKQKLNECPDHRISNNVYACKKWSDKGIRQWDFKDISLKMWGIRGHGEKKKKADLHWVLSYF